MASQVINLKAAGLQTYYQSLMEISPGALLKANNTVINRDGIIEPRRGIKTYSSTSAIVKQLIEYKGSIIRHIGDTLAYDTGSDPVSFSQFSGTYSEPSSGYRIKSVEAKKNLYFTTNDGVKKISATSASNFSTASNYITDCGIPKALSATATISYTGTGFLPETVTTLPITTTYCAYRIVWTYTDANQNLLLGSPSDRIIAANTSSNVASLIKAGVKLKFNIPEGITSADYKYRIYRSEISNTSSPSDELRLVAEYSVTSLDLINKYVEYTDTLTESFRIGGVYLYTNENSGEGILQSNEQPPSCFDLALFKGHMFYANTRTKHALELQLKSVSDFVSGTTTLTITSQTGSFTTYTFESQKEIFRLTFSAGSSFGYETILNIYSPLNTRRYCLPIYRSDLIGSPSLLPNDGRIFLSPISITAATTNANVALAVNNALSTVSTTIAQDFSRVLATNQITFTAQYEGICEQPTFNGTAITVTTTQQGLGDDLITQRVLLSRNSSSDIAVEETAKSLVRNINANVLEKVMAYYISGVGDAPGKILLQKKDVEDVSFSISTNTLDISDDFVPKIGYPTNETTVLVSKNEAIKNRLYYSKYQEVEAVPILNYIDIGSGDFEISRIIALRESLFILKKDGVFRLAGDPGTNPIWDVGTFDNTCLIKAPDTAITVANQCFFFSNQGVVRLNESSLETVSRPIHDKIIPLITTNSNLSTLSFSVAYESDRSFLFWTVSSKTDTKASVCYRYNVETAAWTEWYIPKSCAVLNDHLDKLYFGGEYVNKNGITEYSIDVERKNFDRYDYADREFVFTLNYGDISDFTFTPSIIYDFAVGDVVTQEQYLTIYQFNSLLKKLDMDNGLSFDEFYLNYSASVGSNLTSKMTALVAKLNLVDTTTNYDALWTDSSDFETMQTEFNLVIQALNVSPTTYFSNYVSSNGTIMYETIVTEKNNSYGSVTLKTQPPFIEGSLKLCKAITTEIEYAPQHAGNPASFKQFSSGVFMFERRSFTTAQASYNSDISDNYEEISLTSKVSGTFGDTLWGDDNIWGGEGDQSQIRTYIPLKKQRCRFLGCKFIHNIAFEKYELYGLSLSVRSYTISDRDYK